MFGTNDQKQEWLPKLATGEAIASFALTEPDAGSDAGSAKTKAVRDGNHYVLNGAKRYITNADKATIFTVMARTDQNTPGAKGLSAFIVERDTPGVTIGKPEKKMGQQGANVCDVIFEDARVPITSRLGEEGEGMKVAMSVLDRGRLHISALSVGIAERLVEEMVRYASERKQFGKPIIEHQLVMGMIAESYAEAAAGRAMVMDGRAQVRRQREDHADRGSDQDVVHRDGGPRGGSRCAGAWRGRVYRGLCGGALLSRCAHSAPV